ncbi:hypothetical protein AAY473_001576 [Plecturocebus cupreus]
MVHRPHISLHLNFGSKRPRLPLSGINPTLPPKTDRPGSISHPDPRGPCSCSWWHLTAIRTSSFVFPFFLTFLPCSLFPPYPIAAADPRGPRSPLPLGLSKGEPLVAQSRGILGWPRHTLRRRRFCWVPGEKHGSNDHLPSLRRPGGADPTPHSPPDRKQEGGSRDLCVPPTGVPSRKPSAGVRDCRVLRGPGGERGGVERLQDSRSGFRTRAVPKRWLWTLAFDPEVDRETIPIPCSSRTVGGSRVGEVFGCGKLKRRQESSWVPTNRPKSRWFSQLLPLDTCSAASLVKDTEVLGRKKGHRQGFTVLPRLVSNSMPEVILLQRLLSECWHYSSYTPTRVEKPQGNTIGSYSERKDYEVSTSRLP